MGPACYCFLPLPQTDEEILGQRCRPPQPRFQLPFSLFFPVLDAHGSHTESLTKPGCLAVLNKALELASWLRSPLSPLPAPWDTLQGLVTACPSEVGILPKARALGAKRQQEVRPGDAQFLLGLCRGVLGSSLSSYNPVTMDGQAGSQNLSYFAGKSAPHPHFLKFVVGAGMTP